MIAGENARVRITRGQFQWLQAQAERWTAEGLIDAQARERIITRYDAEALQRQGMIAIVLLAVLMCAVGLLLLIGYNWALIPRIAKLAIVIGAVAGAYGGSAVAYAEDRRVAGETLAFAGTLLFGNAIVLVAQVLQMSGHFPDAVLWFTIGVLATAWLVRSQWIGIEAGLALFIWIVAQGSSTAGPIYGFLVLGPAILAVAYALKSPGMILVAGLDVGFWAFMSGIDVSQSPAWLGSVVLTACALYGAGRWHARDSAMRWAWQGSGLVILLLVLVALMISEVQRSFNAAEHAPLCVALAAVAAGLAGFNLARGPRSVTDRAVILCGGAVVAWLLAVWTGVTGGGPMMARSGTVLFSLLTLVVAVSLIRDALETSSLGLLAGGVVFAATFLVVRWTSVVENLFWSGLILLAAGGGLLVIARLWRNRRRGVREAGVMS